MNSSPNNETLDGLASAPRFPYICAMSKLLLTTLTFITLLPFAATAQDTTWFSNSGANTTADKAAYFRTKQKTDSGWLVIEYFRSGIINYKGLYADDSLHVFNGEYWIYNDKGVPSHLITFVAGKRNGPEVLYHANGNELEKGNNKDDKHDGPWIGYYASGKLAGTATYISGKETEVKLYNEDGSIKDGKIFEQEAQYPGGPMQWLRYMNKNLRYPDYAVKHDIQGTVIVLFKTDKTGKIIECSVIKGVEKHIDEEAFRIIRDSSDWEPALAAGMPVEAWHKQPVIFKF